MIANKAIGIRKDSGLIISVFLIVTVSLLVSTIVLWWFYFDEYDFAYIIENGVEVEATVVDYDYHSESYADGDVNYSSGWYYIWECQYNGRTYRGTGPNGYLRTEGEVLQFLGKSFIVTVDPNSNWVVAKPKSEIRPNGFKFQEYLTGAITCSVIFPIVFVCSFILLLYPIILNNKINKAVYIPILGEVVKTHGFLLYFIKVMYQDKKNVTQEKWARSWFTKNEAKYLEQKKYINILLYKNTFGILEEMQVVKKSRKYET